ncbi:MAG: hypothetical protein CYPHOPRED_000172 [Cyphobasidiales sp. Tagirdzhanova-0007]|nr:MAG: hypothetical protein CYPHOPRED_000172 [Cyphobasidiales sp. Tagirdzhanova-0007]
MSSSPVGSGSGVALPSEVLLVGALSASASTIVSIWSIVLQLKNYRKPLLQRWVVRILLMVPIYSMASLIALYSLDAAFLIDLIRDLYEAFCIYCFFSLLMAYLGGERSLLILLHGREPTPHPWPVSLICKPLDISDPFSFLFLKRGILRSYQASYISSLNADSFLAAAEYVQIKPVLAIITIILKATGTYGDGQFEANAGYTYISVAYNFSVTLSLYCLAMFWICTTRDLQPFRGTGFSYRTFEPAEGGLHSNTGDARARRARAGLRYADGGKTKYWLPMPGANAEEAYGRRPMRAPAIAYVGTDASDRLVDLMEHPMESTSGTGIADFLSNPIQAIGRKIRHQRDADRGYAPIAPEQADEVVHIDPRYVIDEEAGTTAEHLVTRAGVVPFAGLNGQNRRGVGGEASSGDASTESRENMLEFEDIEEDGAEERIYEESRQLEFGDYNYPVLDASKEEARQHMREIEDEFIKGRRGEWRNSLANVQRSSKFEISKKEETAARKKKLNKQQGKNKKKLELPAGCVDILVEDHEAAEDEMTYERERGEPALRTGGPIRIFRRTYGTMSSSGTTHEGARSSLKVPGSASPENTGTVDGANQTSPSAAVAPPAFARLTHLSDGTPFSDNEIRGHSAEDIKGNDMMEDVIEEREMVQEDESRQSRSSIQKSGKEGGAEEQAAARLAKDFRDGLSLLFRFGLHAPSQSLIYVWQCWPHHSERERDLRQHHARHITRNLSNLRPRDDFRTDDLRDMPVKHRVPDASILDHERKRKIEVQCLELQDELEEKALSEDEVERQVSELRLRLSRQGAAPAGQPARGSIKEFQRHELLAAKAIDNARFERALGIRKDYVEGESINKEKQEEMRMQRQLEKERRNSELAERKQIWEREQEQLKAESEARAVKDRAERAEHMERQRLEVESRAFAREARMKEIQDSRERQQQSLLEVRQLWLADLARRHPGGAETVEAFREVEVELAASLALLRLPETAAIAVTTSTGVLPAPASEVADPFLPDSDPDPALAPIRAVARLLDAEVLDAREEEAGLTLERLAHPAEAENGLSLASALPFSLACQETEIELPLSVRYPLTVATEETG